VVFSRTLDSVEGANTTLARDDPRAELTSLQESVRGDVAVGGAAFFPRDHRADLVLIETRTFSSRVVYPRYRGAGR
jgi:hypothetical protein